MPQEISTLQKLKKIGCICGHGRSESGQYMITFRLTIGDYKIKNIGLY